jgi:hypothetical protein
MHGHVLQDFTTIRGAFGTTVTQGESGWLDLDAYEDLTVWIDIREVTFATSQTSLTVNIQTAPIKDEYLFVNMVTGYSQSSTTPPTTPQIQKVILSQNPTVPLGRYVRWQLVPVAGTALSWDLTFRILVCANHVGGARQGHGGGTQGMMGGGALIR